MSLEKKKHPRTGWKGPFLGDKNQSFPAHFPHFPLDQPGSQLGPAHPSRIHTCWRPFTQRLFTSTSSRSSWDHSRNGLPKGVLSTGFITKNGAAKQITLLRVIPTVANDFVIVFLTSHLEVYMAYVFWHSILAFYLASILRSYLAPFWHLFWHFLWHSIWHSFWHSIWHLFWHSFWHSIRHSIPAFYLASVLTFSLTWALPTKIWSSWLRSGSAAMCPLRSGDLQWAVQDRSGWEYSLRTQHGAPNRLASSAKHHCMANFIDTLQTIYSKYMYSFRLVTLYLLYIIMTVLSWLMLVTKSIYPHLTSKLCRIRGRRASGYFTCRPSEQCQMMAKHRKTIGKP